MNPEEDVLKKKENNSYILSSNQNNKTDLNMNNFKEVILNKICYTDLVYRRINKKLNLTLSNNDIEALILTIIKETVPSEFIKIGKNIYISNHNKNIRLTINSFTNRLITADKFKSSTSGKL